MKFSLTNNYIIKIALFVVAVSLFGIFAVYTEYSNRIMYPAMAIAFAIVWMLACLVISIEN